MKRTSFTFLLGLVLSMVGVKAYPYFDTNNKEQVGAFYYYFDDENSTAQVACCNSVVGDITIPSLIEYNNKQYSVTSVGTDAFSVCSGLQHLYSFAKSVPKAANAFRTGIAFSFATLHVPAESMYSYNAAEGWNKFINIVALTDNDPKPTGITNINNDIEKGERYYSLDGKRMAQPQRGLNIIRKSDGTTSKVFVK